PRALSGEGRSWVIGSAQASPVLPPVMHPEPVGGVAAYGGLEGAVDVGHDLGHGPGLAVLVGGDFLVGLDAPAGEADAVADGHEEGAIVAQGEDGGGGG